MLVGIFQHILECVLHLKKKDISQINQKLFFSQVQPQKTSLEMKIILKFLCFNFSNI